MTTDDDIVSRLRRELSAVEPPGAGPDLARIDARGRARRRRHRVGIASAVAAVCVSGAVATSPQFLRVPDDDSTTSGAPAQTATLVEERPNVTDTAAVEAVMLAVLSDAGIATDPSLPPELSTNRDTAQPLALTWRLPAADGEVYNASLVVYPPGVMRQVRVAEGRPQLIRPECEAASHVQELRNCDVSPVDGGGWAESFEVLEKGYWSEGQEGGVLRLHEWQPQARALLSNGTFVMARVVRIYGPGPALLPDQVTTYAGDVTAAQLKAAVSDPNLMTIDRP